VNSNSARDNGEDGIHIVATADSTSLDLNTTKNNAGEGTEDDGTNTTITNNTSSRNRQDCAGSNAGGGVYGPGNTCADGSTFFDAGVITAPVRRTARPSSSEHLLLPKRPEHPLRPPRF
jgi:hypothetical protein